jgi:ABC-type transporter Mla maintaining outer membrane lipid asymmetry permease subunit MlaE
MVAGRTGSAIAAEIASTKVTEQIDALASMAINPIQYLVSPRIIAGLISMPLLTLSSTLPLSIVAMWSVSRYWMSVPERISERWSAALFSTMFSAVC